MKKIKTKEEELKHLIDKNVLLAQVSKNEDDNGAFAIETKEELKDFIKGITSSQLKNENYTLYFLATKTSIVWFKDLYKKEFFNVNEKEGIITLNPLPNGIRRTRVYKKKSDNDKTLKKSISRIVKSIGPKLAELDFAFKVKKSMYLDMEGHRHLEEIRIYLDDLRKHNELGSSRVLLSTQKAFVILFNKKTWEYEFTYIVVPRDLKEVEKIVRWGFEKHTASTRNYRAKNPQ